MENFKKKVKEIWTKVKTKAVEIFKIVKEWVIAHKVASIIIASVLAVAIILAIVLPIALSDCKHKAFDDGVVTKEATCTEEGIMTYTCTKKNCGYTKTEAIPAKGHTSVDVDAVAPSCGVAGTTAGKKCSVCNEVLEGITAVDPTGEHTYDEGVVTTEPSCVAGVKTYTCTVCQGTKTEEIPAVAEHTYDEGVVTTEPSCAVGVKTYTCSVCQGTKEEEIPAVAEHTYDEGVVTTEPSCAVGVKTFTCTVCQGTKTEEIAATAEHTWVDATCTAPKTCSECGATEGEALGHAWNEGEVTTAPTCDAEGVKTFTCTVCGETKTEAVEALGHTWNEGEVTTAPTCDAEGVKTFTCTVCGETKTEEIAIDPEAHAFVATTETVITETGVYYIEECACGATQNGAAVEGYTVATDDVVVESNKTVVLYGDKNFGTITLSGELENVTITAANGAKVSNIVIAADANINGLTIENVVFANDEATSYNVQLLGTVTDLAVNGCTFNGGENLTNNAIEMKDGTVTGLTVSDCTFNNLGENSIAVYIGNQENVGTVVVSDNNVNTFGHRFVRIHEVDAGSITISGNELANWGEPEEDPDLMKASNITTEAVTLESENNTLDGNALADFEELADAGSYENAFVVNAPEVDGE